MRRALLSCLLLSATLAAQDAPPTGEQITFLPPPIEGTLSAGVYTKDGKLIRILAREATEKKFIVGLNGFITHWDGKDDSGKVAPAGTYFVRGFGVGEIEVEGIAFHGNDWIKDGDSPRFAEINAIEIAGPDLIVRGIAPDGKLAINAAVNLKDGAVRFLEGDASSPSNSSPTKTSWSIERIGTEDPAVFAVVQRSPDGSDVLRRLDYEPAEPQPLKVVARADDQAICLLERSAGETRVRILTLQEAAKVEDGAESKWGIVFSASIRRPPAPEGLAAYLNRTPPPKLETTVRQGLIRNELLETAPAAVQLGVLFDERGSYLRTADGLPLRQLTDTPHLKWAALSREADGALTLFQSDGATVEEFRLKTLNQMMAFDAGDYEWTPPK